MTCRRCRYEFVLSPKSAPYSADRRFVKAIAAASRDGERPYTPGQLHAAMFRRRNRGFWRRYFLAAGSSDPDATADAVDKWARAGRDLGPIIRHPQLESTSHEGEAWPEPDLFDYGAEGVLVVDDRTLVDLLVGLRLHTMAKVVIIEAWRAYPAPVVSRLRPTVAARPDLPMFLLHASGLHDDEVAHLEDAARALLGAAANPVTDLGLAPDAATRLGPLRWARQMRSVPADMLPSRWLTGGLAAAIAADVSLDALVHPAVEPGAEGAGSHLLWDPDSHGDGDGDFG